MLRGQLVDKPLQTAGMSADNVPAEKLSEKWTFGREAKLRGQIWNFEDRLSDKDIISRHTSKPERVYLFYNPPISFHFAATTLVSMVENPVVIWWQMRVIEVRKQVNLIGLANSTSIKTWQAVVWN